MTKLGRPKQRYDFPAMRHRGLYVSGYAFAEYMGLPYWQVKNLIRSGKIATHTGADGSILIPNPARDPKMMDAEWDKRAQMFTTPFPGLRSEGLI